MNHRDMTKDSIVIRTAENYAVRVGYNRDVFDQSMKTFSDTILMLKPTFFQITQPIILISKVEYFFGRTWS